MAKIKVLIIDDSALVRQMLTTILEADQGIEVVGAASDPLIARNKIKQLNPDVLTLDVEMPNMDGISFLRNLMRLRPIPVVMVSTLTEAGAQITLDALELGAVDFIHKPKTDFSNTINDYSAELVQKVKVASKARVRTHLANRTDVNEVNRLKVNRKNTADVILRLNQGSRRHSFGDTIIAIGASTGGVEAIMEIVSEMPADSPAVLIAQHIPGGFSASFANRLDKFSPMKVCEASDRQKILPGHVYLAPGDRHLLIKNSAAGYFCRLDNGELVNRHKPSVDVLFRSVAGQIGRLAIGVILTGMGSDGAEGLLEMKRAGAVTIAQDEQTSVVWGMPAKAVENNAVDHILALNNIAYRLVSVSAARAA